MFYIIEKIEIGNMRENIFKSKEGKFSKFCLIKILVEQTTVSKDEDTFIKNSGG